MQRIRESLSHPCNFPYYMFIYVLQMRQNYFDSTRGRVLFCHAYNKPFKRNYWKPRIHVDTINL